MKTSKRLLMASLPLGVLSLGCFILERMAMTDIFHGEPNLDLEWGVVSTTFPPIIVFHLISIVAIACTLFSLRKPSARSDVEL